MKSTLEIWKELKKQRKRIISSPSDTITGNIVLIVKNDVLHTEK
jgi:hypothetical protein